MRIKEEGQNTQKKIMKKKKKSFIEVLDALHGGLYASPGT